MTTSERRQMCRDFVRHAWLDRGNLFYSELKLDRQSPETSRFGFIVETVVRRMRAVAPCLPRWISVVLRRVEVVPPRRILDLDFVLMIGRQKQFLRGHRSQKQVLRRLCQPGTPPGSRIAAESAF